MGLFSLGEGAAAALGPRGGRETAKQGAGGSGSSLLAQGSRFEGLTRVEGSLRVDGVYDGPVQVGETLVVGRTGQFTGDIKARDVVVCGTLRGTIEATGSVELQRGSRFEGDVRTKALIVEDGVFFQGSCRMEEPEGIVTLGAPSVDGKSETPAAEREGLLEFLSKTTRGRRQAAVPSATPVAAAGGSKPAAASGGPNGREAAGDKRIL